MKNKLIICVLRETGCCSVIFNFQFSIFNFQLNRLCSVIFNFQFSIKQELAKWNTNN
jgi:hypothetical protein